MKMTEGRRLLVFVALVLLIPAVLSQVLPNKTPFDQRPLARLRATKPDVIMMSDSMLNNSVDPKLMGELLGGRRVELLWYGSSASASWYFRLKNYIIASGNRPELLCILFREQLLTDPGFRTTGTYLYKLEAAMHADEPIYRLLLGDEFKSKQQVENMVTSVYPLNARIHVSRERIERMCLRALANFGTTVGELQAGINETFALPNLRGGGTAEAVALSQEEERDFDPDPRHSFLPHIVQLAAEARIPLCFIRARRYPGPDGRVPQSERMRKYMADLRAWIEKQGCHFIDDTDNLKRTRDMFLKPGDDHTGPLATRRSTELYADELRPLLTR
jgi:hypothetical protein